MVTRPAAPTLTAREVASNARNAIAGLDNAQWEFRKYRVGTLPTFRTRRSALSKSPSKTPPAKAEAWRGGYGQTIKIRFQRPCTDRTQTNRNGAAAAPAIWQRSPSREEVGGTRLMERRV